LGKAEVLEFAKQLKPNDHAIMLYSDPEDKLQVFSVYLKAVLEKHGAAAYFFSQENAVQIATDLKQHGVAVDRHMQKGALHLIDQTRQHFLEADDNPTQGLDAIRVLYNQLSTKGFKQVLIIEEMASFLEYQMMDYLIKYEGLLQKNLDVPVMKVCAYDFELLCKQGNGDLYLNLIKSHGTIIFAGPKEWIVKSY
jgi:hypothetical protein